MALRSRAYLRYYLFEMASRSRCAAPSVYVTCIRFAFERSSMHVAYHVAAQHVHLCVKNNVCEMASCTACISLSAKKRDGVTATRRRALRDVHLPPLGVVHCEYNVA